MLTGGDTKVRGAKLRFRRSACHQSCGIRPLTLVDIEDAVVVGIVIADV